MKNNTVMIVIIAVIVGAGAFFGGMKYQQSKATGSNFTRQFQGGGGQGNRQSGQTGQGRFSGGGSGRPIVGEVISGDDKSITVKMQDGGSKIVLLPESVTVSKTDTGSRDDLKSGVRVGVFGTDNSDGSITAQNVQINPMFRTTTGTGSGLPR